MVPWLDKKSIQSREIGCFFFKITDIKRPLNIQYI